MHKLDAPKADTSQAYLTEAGERLADLCTGCGACFSACPIATLAGIEGADAVEVTQGMRALAKGEPAGDVSVAWVGACGRSGLCISACPEQSKGLNAMLLVRIAKQQAINVTGQLPGKADAYAFPRVKTFARLQLTDEELEAWL